MNSLRSVEVGKNWKDVPDGWKSIIRRGLPPSFVKVFKSASSRISNDPLEIEKKMLRILGKLPEHVDAYDMDLYSDPDTPSPPPDYHVSHVETLTASDRASAMKIILQAGRRGLPLSNEGGYLFCLPADTKNPMRLFAVENIGAGAKPVCTTEGCFETCDPLTQHPAKCGQHRGKLTGFVLCRAETKNGSFRIINYSRLTYAYNKDTEKDDYSWAISRKSSSLNPVGSTVTYEKFLTKDDLDKRAAVCETALLLASFADSQIKCDGMIALANGLEKDVEEELLKYGWTLFASRMNTKREELKLIPFSLGERVDVWSNWSSLSKDGFGILYYMSDNNAQYGGQTVAGNKSTVHSLKYNPQDTVVKYLTLFPSTDFDRIPICVVKEENLFEMEAVFICVLYVAYLLARSNPFNPSVGNSSPYLLNKLVNSSLLKSNAWRLIQLTLMREYGVQVEMIKVDQPSTSTTPDHAQLTMQTPSSSTVTEIQPQLVPVPGASVDLEGCVNWNRKRSASVPEIAVYNTKKKPSSPSSNFFKCPEPICQHVSPNEHALNLHYRSEHVLSNLDAGDYKIKEFSSLFDKMSWEKVYNRRFWDHNPDTWTSAKLDKFRNKDPQ